MLNLATCRFLAAIAVCSQLAAAEDSRLGYPDHYRSWTHIKTAIISEDHPLAGLFGGIHHIYGNDEALQGLERKRYEPGAVFVFDLLSVREHEETLIEGERKRVDVMRFDPRRFASTGGWGFETFVGNSRSERLEQNVATSCYQCHQSAESSGYVYSKYRE